MKKTQVFILMFFAGIMAAFIYADNPHYYQNRVCRRASKYRKYFGKQICKQYENVQGKIGNYYDLFEKYFDKVQDKLPF